MEHMQTIVITRHAALVQFLKETGIVGDNVTVIAQATEADVAGKHVIGVLPLHLAALAAKVTTLNLNTPSELRGVELSVEQLREFSSGVTTYVVRIEE